MSAKDHGFHRADTDASLRVERRNTDRELSRRVAVATDEADEVLRIARERADRLLAATRAAADARLPLSQQTKEAVALLLDQREEEDRAVAAGRAEADEELAREKRARRQRLSVQLELERHTTEIHLALERTTSDKAISSRDEFLAQASHDLRGLMAAQKVYLSLLAKEASSGSQLATYVAALVKIDAQMERMISDLVDIVAIDAGKLAVTLAPYSAVELLSTAQAVFEPLAKERGQSLSMASGLADVSILVDAGRGVQVLGNLLSNAVKFTPRGGQIRVGFEATEDEVIFCVADTGPGVPPERAEHIFERFVGSSTGRTGLGLGLFIASRVVDAHGGRLWFDRDESGGSLFRFTLRRLK